MPRRPRDNKEGGSPSLRWYGLCLVAAGALAYANSLDHPFIFDDRSIVDFNPQFREWPSLRMFDVPPESPVAGRPLPNLSFVLNWAVGGDDPRGYHLVNLALHLACAFLVFGIVRRTMDTCALPFAAALIWTVHPLNTEVVDYLMQRTESMMAVCYLLTIYASVRAYSSPASRQWPIVAVVACAAGMASKESMVTAPLAVIAYDRVFLFESIGRMVRARWRLYAGLAAGWIVLAALMWSHPRTFSAGFTNIHVSSMTYLLNQLVIVPWYLWLSIWPKDLVLFYGWARPLGLADIWPQALLVAGLTAATLFLLVRRPPIGLLGLWVALTLAPSSSFAPIAAEVGAERRMYLPLIGIVVLAVAAAGWLLRRTGPESDQARSQPEARSRSAPGPAEAGRYVLILIVVALGARTFLRNREYASALTMARTVVDRWATPVAHDMLGTALSAEGRHDEALAHLGEAAREYPAARYSLGAELLNLGRVDEAAPWIDAYAGEQPRDARARAARIGLGRAFEARGQWARAADQYQALVEVRPDDAEAHGLLAGALGGAERYAEAIPHFRMYLSTAAGDGGAWTGLGISLIGTQRTPEAVEAFQRAVAANPNDATYHRNLARALASLGRITEAREALARSLALDPNDPLARDLKNRLR